MRDYCIFCASKSSLKTSKHGHFNNSNAPNDTNDHCNGEIQREETEGDSKKSDSGSLDIPSDKKI